MAPRRLPLPLGLKAGKGKDSTVSFENAINLYVEVTPGIAPVHLLGIPGQTLFSTIGGARRGQIEASGRHFAIRGSTLYEVSSLGVATSRGTIDGSKRCDLTNSADYVHIVADIRSYNFRLSTNTLTELTDGDFDTAVSVAFVSGLPVYARLNTGQIAWPSLTNFEAFDALDFAEAESNPDEIKAVRESAQELLIFSEHSLEPWRFTGNADQYFEASGAAAALNVGALCRDAIVTNMGIDKAPYWLAHSKAGGLYVARLAGYQDQRVSNYTVERSLESASDPTTAYAYGYQRGGHSFYVITIPGHCTWAYDASTNEWAQRQAGSWPLSSPELPQGDWDVIDLAVNGDRKIIVGKSDGNLYELDDSSYSQDGAGICREITTPPFFTDGRSFTISEIELICGTGTGLVSGDDSDPKVQMALSFDGGKNWTDPFEEDLGALGDYGIGVRFNRCGWCPGPKGVQVRFRCTNAVAWTPIEAFITVEPGSR